MRAVRAKRVVAALWVFGAVGGCTTWKVQSAPPAEVLKNPDVHAVQVTSIDSARTKVEIYDPVLVGDSISGHPTKTAVARIYFPLSRVQAIATRRPSFGKTILIGLAVAGGIGVYALLQELNPPGY